MRKRKYRRLREEDRHIIYRMSKAVSSQTQIANALGVSQATVSKELARNRGQKGYRPKQANAKARQRQKTKRKRSPVIEGTLEQEVRRRLEIKHSPEQISLALKAEGERVSHQSIYAYIQEDKRQGGQLYKHLRINGKRRYRRRCKAQRSKIPNRRGIEERPKSVDSRLRYGDWEVDLIEGSKGSGFILSLYERKSRLGRLCKLHSKGSQETAQAIIRELVGYKVRTLTYDNGLEFAGHESVTQSLGAKGYFCQPYHSWEKGGVENFNGLVRQYLPKGSSFRELTTQELKDIQDQINQRPRKILKAKSPSQLEYKLAA